MAKEKKKVTKEEWSWKSVEKEADQIEAFIKQLPKELKADAACCLIERIVIWGGDNLYESLGILEQAKLSHRETSLRISREEKCRCTTTFTTTNEYKFVEGEIYDVFVDEEYCLVYDSDRNNYPFRKECFAERFELVEEAEQKD